jgi:hydroxymethylpyrimidine pyrophosphatase-like HAD family hydrolase
LISRVLEDLGAGRIGLPALVLVWSLVESVRKEGRMRLRKKLCKIHIRKDKANPSPHRPMLIATDIEGCVTPHNRTELDLDEIQRLREYCQYAKKHTEYPSIVFFTGRSQGYVEALAQMLDMFERPGNLPFVIENGSALYDVDAKRTTPLIDEDQRKLIADVRVFLMRELQDCTFEPKAYMITVNPRKETVPDLRVRINGLLSEKGYRNKLEVVSTASAVDITIKDISKLSGLKKALESASRGAVSIGLEEVLAMGDSDSDLTVLEAAGTACCPAEHVSDAVRKAVEKKGPKGHVIPLPNIQFVIRAIERETGLTLR